MNESGRPSSPSPYQAGSLVVSPRPDEFGFALREDEFQILCDGEVGTARASRDLFLGIFGGAVVGLIHIIATTDWQTIWQPNNRVTFFPWCGVLLVIVTLSAMGAIIFHLRLTKTRTDSAYARLEHKVSAYFAAQKDRATNPSSSALGLTIISARYGADTSWVDVAERLQARIQNGNLRISATNDELGGDPAPSVRKSMEVAYTHGGQPHTKTVHEGETLSIPEP
jgi:hypothetical protein